MLRQVSARTVVVLQNNHNKANDSEVMSELSGCSGVAPRVNDKLPCRDYQSVFYQLEDLRQSNREFTHYLASVDYS